ncbi:MAG: hypothetical protein EBZ48_02990, partial [Proteobacteria bacterium]|nr:hypothetical protein [Pseudomonadota bacterium]
MITACWDGPAGYIAVPRLQHSLAAELHNYSCRFNVRTRQRFLKEILRLWRNNKSYKEPRVLMAKVHHHQMRALVQNPRHPSILAEHQVLQPLTSQSRW